MNLGFVGGVLITDTTAITGTFRAIQALTDATFTTLTSDITVNGEEDAAEGSDFGTLSAGMAIYGTFTAITLASGTVIAYK
jgi:hypothetical protein